GGAAAHVAPGGTAGPPARQRAARPGCADRCRPRADDAAGAAVLGVGRGVHAGAVAEHLARGALAGAVDAAPSPRADGSAGAAVLPVRRAAGPGAAAAHVAPGNTTRPPARERAARPAGADRGRPGADVAAVSAVVRIRLLVHADAVAQGGSAG